MFLLWPRPLAPVLPLRRSRDQPAVERADEMFPYRGLAVTCWTRKPGGALRAPRVDGFCPEWKRSASSVPDGDYVFVRRRVNVRRRSRVAVGRRDCVRAQLPCQAGPEALVRLGSGTGRIRFPVSFVRPPSASGVARPRRSPRRAARCESPAVLSPGLTGTGAVDCEDLTCGSPREPLASRGVRSTSAICRIPARANVLHQLYTPDADRHLCP